MNDELRRIQEAAIGNARINPRKIRLRPLADKDLSDVQIEVNQYRPFSHRSIVEGGIFDMRLKDNWGYINLPVKVVNPLLLELVAKAFKARVNDLLSHKRYAVVLQENEKGLIEVGDKVYEGRLIFEDDNGGLDLPEDEKSLFMGERFKGIVATLEVASSLKTLPARPKSVLLTRWPVMPWSFRPFSDYGWGYVMHPINLLYTRLLMAITRLKKLENNDVKNVNDIPAVYTLIQRAVYEIVFGGHSYQGSPVKGVLSSLAWKEGVVRQRILGQRIDYSGRATIVPAPELKIDEVFIPKSIAVDIFKPHIIRNIRKSGYPGEITRKMIEEWVFSIEGTPVLINRQPTLHKYSIMGFRARVWDKNVIGLHPLVVEPFNADFDGDTMAVWTAISEEGMRDIEERMMVIHNLTLPSGKVYAVPRHDYLHGLWKLTRECEASPAEPLNIEGLDLDALMDLVDKHGPCTPTTSGTTLGRALVSLVAGFPIDFEINKKTVHKLTSPLERYLKIIDDLKWLGSRYGSDSFSLKDLWELRPEKRPRSVEDLDADVERLKKLDNPAVNMVKSGSRGSWSQIQQMVSTKGYVRSPSGLRRVEHALIEGLSPEEYWSALHGSRASLVDKVVTIADPGYLARKMVMAATDQIVVEEDCGSSGELTLPERLASGLPIVSRLRGGMVKVRSPVTCKVKGPGVCKACAGKAEVGDYLGIIAATTLSEPTTQLTLRVFHTGGEVGNVPIVSSVSGRVEDIGQHFITIGGYQIYVPQGYRIVVNKGDEVSEGTILALRVSSIGVTQDFGDLEALYELRSTGGVVSPAKGTLDIEVQESRVLIRVGNHTWKVSRDKRILKARGQEVEVGDRLVDGVPDYKELYKLIGMRAVVLWLDQIKGIYEKNGIKVSSRDLLSVARAMFVGNEWKGIKAAMNEKDDIILRLGGENVLKTLSTKGFGKNRRIEFKVSSEASRVLFEVPPYGSGVRK